MLRGGSGEAVGLGDDVAKDGAGIFRQAGAGGGDHALLAPLLVLQVECFADAVGIGEQEVAGLEDEVALLVDRVGQQADDGATAIEGVDLTATKNVGRIVAGVDVAQQARGRRVDAEEEGCVAVGSGGL